MLLNKKKVFWPIQNDKTPVSLGPELIARAGGLADHIIKKRKRCEKARYTFSVFSVPLIYDS
jgi:hypothetical protein